MKKTSISWLSIACSKTCHAGCSSCRGQSSAELAVCRQRSGAQPLRTGHCRCGHCTVVPTDRPDTTNAKSRCLGLYLSVPVVKEQRGRRGCNSGCCDLTLAPRAVILSDESTISPSASTGCRRLRVSCPKLRSTRCVLARQLQPSAWG